MYAVVRTGGKQYRIEPGIEFLVEKLEGEPGSAVVLTDVLLLADDKEVTVGSPLVAAKVNCEVVAQELGPKLRTLKYSRSNNDRRHHGHRQKYTRLVVNSMERN
ncbi:MAG: 50S ribosomal protein L21 [Deltaproteobacteria bacterium]|nr:50S ribosomal protein L21 [Deltaproteobacteria bacterium]MBI3294359.1 50S ribosomal protein L21 [Deltaproteobacteria bacterium]